MSIKSKAVSSSSVTVAALSALNIGPVESLPLATVMTEGAENYSRPGWNATAPTGIEALAANLEAVGQMNPVLYVERDGKRVLVAGFRRFAALSFLHAKGKGTGTILARRVTTKDAETLPTAAVPALVNLVENEDAKVATGVMGRLAAYKALADAGLSAARIAALTGQGAVDYVADTLRLTSAECDPRLLLAAKAHDAEADAWKETVTINGAEVKAAGRSMPFGLVRLIGRGFPYCPEDKAGDRFTQWEVCRKVSGLSIAKARPVLELMGKGRKAVKAAEAAAEAEREAAAEAARLKREAANGGKERGAGDSEESTKGADAVRETAATLTVPVLLDIRAALAGDKPQVGKALDLISKALGKGGAFGKAFTDATVAEAVDAY